MIGAIGWQASPAAWLALLGAALAGAAAIVAYRRVARVRFSKWMLLARLIALALLAAAAFAPALDVAAPVNQKRQVVLLLDDSLSMGETDTRADGPLLRIAEALHYIPRAAWAGDDLLEHARRLPAAMSAVEAARAQRDQARLAGASAEPEQKKFDDLSAALRSQTAGMLSSAKLNDVLKFAVEPLTRIDTALADANAILPARPLEQLINEIEHHQRQADAQRARQDAAASAAAKRASAMSRYDLAVAAGRQLSTAILSGATATWATLDGAGAATPPEKPDRPASPITSSLAAVVDHLGAADCEGVVLLSDGRSTEARAALAPSLLGAGVPIYAVEIAAAQNAPDVRLAKITVPATALTGEAVPVRITLQNHAANGTAAHITLTDGKTTQKRDITLTDAGDVIDFTWPAAAAPMLKLTATVDPLPNETRTENNRKDATVAVVDRKLHVTLIAQSAGWDLQYLRNALARSPWVELHQQILAAGESCRFTPKELADEDVFVLCDVPPAALSTQQCDAIQTAISTKGKSALLLPGDGDWLRAITQQPLLAALVPQRIDAQPAWRLAPSETPTIQPVPSAQAAALPLLKLDDTADASAARWLARPRIYRYVSASELKPQVRTLLEDRSTRVPLMVEQAVGSGRAMTMLIDETWRWRRDTGAEPGDRFWLDIVRDLTDPPMQKTQDDLSIGVDRDPVSAGQPLAVRARVPASAAASARLSLIQNEKTIASITPAEMLPGSGRLTATFTPESPGHAELLLTAGGEEIRLPITIGDALAEELADTSGDPQLLHRIAEQTGGAVVPLESLDTLPPQIALRHSTRIDTIHLDLWSSPYWFAAIVACLGLEWAMRKLAGMI